MLQVYLLPLVQDLHKRVLAGVSQCLPPGVASVNPDMQLQAHGLFFWCTLCDIDSATGTDPHVSDQMTFRLWRCGG